MKIPWAEEPGGPQMRWQQARHNWATEHTSDSENLPVLSFKIVLGIPDCHVNFRISLPSLSLSLATWWDFIKSINHLWIKLTNIEMIYVPLCRSLVSLCSVLFSQSVLSDCLRPHGLQHVRLPCPSPTPRVYSNLCPLSQRCHPTISSSVVPSSSCLQSFPASGSFQMSQFFASGGQSIRVSASTSVLPMNIQDWFPLGWTSRISLQSKGLSRAFSNTIVEKHQFFGTQLSL